VLFRLRVKKDINLFMNKWIKKRSFYQEKKKMSFLKKLKFNKWSEMDLRLKNFLKLSIIKNLKNKILSLK